MGVTKYLYCDLDGTFINLDLEREFIFYLSKSRKLNIYNYALSFITIPINTCCHLFYKSAVLKSWSALRSEKVITGWIESFFVEKSEKIKINEDVLSYIKIFEGKKILLTSCYQPLAEKFLVHGGYVGLFDKVIGTLMGKNNIRVLRNPFGKGKCKFIKADSYTVGIANEDADIFYLSICNEAIAVNPEVKLRKTALKKRWRVIDVRT